jgi:hypothetical protein
MPDFQMPAWSKYLLALAVAVLVGTISAIPDLQLPSPQDSGWNPLVGLAHALIVGAAFSLIAFTATVWYPRGDNRAPTGGLVQVGKRPLVVFLLFAMSDFVLQVLSRPFFSWLSGHSKLQDTLARLVQSGRGWLLPLMFLAVFIAVILLRHRRA